MDFKFKVLDYRVVDGDTIDAIMDVGFCVRVKQRLRLIGIDAPESRTRDLEEKKRGLAATEWLKNKLDNAEKIIVMTEKTGKYGRYLATVFADGVNLNRLMLEEGQAVPYV